MATLKQTLARNAVKRIAFLRGAQMNGVAGFDVVCRELETWAEHGDWRGLATLLKECAVTDRRALNAIVGECVLGYTFKGGKFVKPEDGASYGLDGARIAEFRTLQEGGASFRTYQKVKAKEELTDAEAAEKAIRSLEANMAKCARQAIRQDVSKADAIAAFAAQYDAAKTA